MTPGPVRVNAGVLLLAMALPAGAAAAAQSRDAFRVCADPYSLPSSSRTGEGYENRIAALFAKSLGVPLAYEWFPQRLGFVRNTLRNDDTPEGRYRCDIVMGVPEDFELAATTRPYYRSVWTMVLVKGRGLDAVAEPADLVRLAAQREPLLRLGAFDRSPAVEWLFRNGLIEHLVPYPIMSGDARAYPGQILEQDLASGALDVAFVWGPIAGYFANRIENAELAVIPMPLDSGVKFDYQIAMAVRFGEPEWKAQIEDLLDRHQADIEKILKEYGVPLLPVKPRASREDD
jgi:quinoprotein dehydrogenase-associated probable ABC transporter substrate-binding protein